MKAIIKLDSDAENNGDAVGSWFSLGKEENLFCLIIHQPFLLAFPPFL